jgi:GLPGLI family protein
MLKFTKPLITLLFASFIILSLTSVSLSPQELKGKAVYQTHQKIDVSIDSTEISEERQEALSAMLAKQFNKSYELVFDKKQSSYKEQEKLDEPSAPAGGAMVFVMMSDASSLLYKNTEEKNYASQRDVFGKGFLVKDELETRDWKMTSESKQIGQYTCYKATATRMTGPVVSIKNGVRSESPGEEITITAWYAPEIPVSNGPELYWGLPGLIMEVHDGNQVIVCTKLILNTQDKIEEPTKGKVVTEEEYEEIMDEKMQEMQKIEMGGKKKGGEGHRMEITIEG